MTIIPIRVTPDAVQHPVSELPADAIQFLVGSRYCEVDRLGEIAWSFFGHTPLGWPRVQAVCDWVHANVEFGYHHARSTKTAYDTFCELKGVCRDFTHLAITFCRCLNIPARYTTGYLGDIGVPASDFADGLQRLVRSLSWGALAHVRRKAQQAANRPYSDGQRPRRRRRRLDDRVWPEHAEAV